MSHSFPSIIGSGIRLNDLQLQITKKSLIMWSRHRSRTSSCPFMYLPNKILLKRNYKKNEKMVWETSCCLLLLCCGLCVTFITSFFLLYTKKNQNDIHFLHFCIFFVFFFLKIPILLKLMSEKKLSTFKTQKLNKLKKHFF